jgi:hypothetical protein
MSERPILFSGPMVRAILDGIKTQTRRPVKPQPHAGVRSSPFVQSGVEDGHGRELRWPLALGDWLWVKETWSTEWIMNPGDTRVAYRADELAFDADYRWRPSIHMPRWASRLTLKVTGVRVERLQSISAEDCIAEGLTTTLREHDAACDLRDQFRAMWDATYAKRGYGWETNLWVWVIGFRALAGEGGAGR